VLGRWYITDPFALTSTGRVKDWLPFKHVKSPLEKSAKQFRTMCRERNGVKPSNTRFCAHVIVRVLRAYENASARRTQKEAALLQNGMDTRMSAGNGGLREGVLRGLVALLRWRGRNERCLFANRKWRTSKQAKKCDIVMKT